MTTRTRRNKPQQARDILLALLKDQEAEAAKHKAAYEGANLRATSTRRAIELLDQPVLPGMDEAPRIVYVPGPMPRMGTGDDIDHPNTSEVNHLTLTDVVVAEAMGDAEVTVMPPSPSPCPHQQRIGEKAQGINDVWKAGEGVVSVHTDLMYARQDLCEWCKKGVPFQTDERTGHHVITKNEDGVERGFLHEPCKGIKEPA